MYDLFEDTFGLMITVKNESIRKQCKEIVLNFIQSFPLSDQLLEKILLRLVNNLDYAEHDGRQAVLSIFDRLFERVPLEAFGKTLDTIFFGFTTRLVNEEVDIVRDQMMQVFKRLIEKVQGSEEHIGLINKMFDNCQKWMSSPSDETKRAGLQLINLMFWATGQYSRIEKVVEAMVVDLEQVCNSIAEFWDHLKADQDLKETLQDNLWKDVFWDEGDVETNNPLSRVKSTKNLVLDYLHFIEVIMVHEKTKERLRSDLYGITLRLSRHPDEDVQIQVLKVSEKLFSHGKHRQTCKEHLKSLLVCLFASIKSRHLNDSIVPVLNNLFKFVIQIMIPDTPKLLSMIMTALSSITFKHLRLAAKGATVANKCLSVARGILYSVQTTIDDGDLESLLAFFLRLLEHGAIRDNKETSEQLELDMSKIETLASSSDLFLSLVAKLKSTIVGSKLTSKIKQVRDRVADNDRKKRRRREKTMEVRMGLPEKRVKLI